MWPNSDRSQSGTLATRKKLYGKMAHVFCGCPGHGGIFPESARRARGKMPVGLARARLWTATVAPISKSAVSRVSNPQTSRTRAPCRLEIGDTAGSETCATLRSRGINGDGAKLRPRCCQISTAAGCFTRVSIVASSKPCFSASAAR